MIKKDGETESKTVKLRTNLTDGNENTFYFGHQDVEYLEILNDEDNKVLVSSKNAVKINNKLEQLKYFSMNVSKGELIKLKINSKYVNGRYNSDIEWFSSNPEIVKIDDMGNIQALKKGESIISAKAKNDEIMKVSFKIYVFDSSVSRKYNEEIK